MPTCRDAGFGCQLIVYLFLLNYATRPAKRRVWTLDTVLTYLQTPLRPVCMVVSIMCFFIRVEKNGLQLSMYLLRSRKRYSEFSYVFTTFLVQDKTCIGFGVSYLSVLYGCYACFLFHLFVFFLLFLSCTLWAQVTPGRLKRHIPLHSYRDPQQAHTSGLYYASITPRPFIPSQAAFNLQPRPCSHHNTLTPHPANLWPAPRALRAPPAARCPVTAWKVPPL